MGEAGQGIVLSSPPVCGDALIMSTGPSRVTCSKLETKIVAMRVDERASRESQHAK
jgi:hypothetical protein